MVEVLGRCGIGCKLTVRSWCCGANLITNESIGEWLDDKNCEEYNSQEEDNCEADELPSGDRSLPCRSEVDAPPLKDDIDQYRGESPWEEQSSCVELLNNLSDIDDLVLGRDIASLQRRFEGGCVRCKGDLAGSRIVNRVIVHKERHA